MKGPAIVLFRRDLRLTDNPALTEAAKLGVPIIPLYIDDEGISKKRKIGGASRWWLHYSLESLMDALEAKKAPMIIRRGDPCEIVPQIAKQAKASAVYWNRRYEPQEVKQDASLEKELRELSAQVKTFKGSLLIEPWEAATKQGGFYKVFTPFWRACLEMILPEKPLPVPKIPPSNGLKLKSERLEEWNLAPKAPDWAGGLRESWVPGEEAAKKELKEFVSSKLKEYEKLRDFPAAEATSLLSPRLHFGELSPRQIFYETHENRKFIEELGWREFCAGLLYHFPKLPDKPFNEKFASFPWKTSKRHLKAWQQGMTGYPIVDAGMRQLWHTGWMHNRVRMIAASFLTKHLGIYWGEGEKWFWDTLVDADLASNAANWQWVAGCGADAAPYFRIFNPILQGQKFDPEGVYIKRWLPELKHLPKESVHTPWKASPVNYPPPLVDHRKAREEALARSRS